MKLENILEVNRGNRIIDSGNKDKAHRDKNLLL